MKKAMLTAAIGISLAFMGCQKNNVEVLGTAEADQTALSTTNTCIGAPLKGVSCLDVYQPVCGCNGVTYSNACQAAVAGVKSYRAGSCDGTGPGYRAAGK
jgi:Kazal-type serine protease inhibitor domain